VNLLLSETRKEGIEVKLESCYQRAMKVVKNGESVREEKEIKVKMIEGSKIRSENRKQQTVKQN
jgi:hypothetical protein